MSILIMGMEMPTSCGKCYVGFCKQIGCELSIGFDDYKISRHPNCPLVLVPKHGRLIDADAVMNKVKDEKGRYISQFAAVVGEAIDAAPTIILAEPPKDETQAGPYDLLYEEGGPDA